jgi:hypothetical protein
MPLQIHGSDEVHATAADVVTILKILPETAVHTKVAGRICFIKLTHG